MINQELIIEVLSDSSINLEWHELKEEISKSQETLQKEILKRFSEDYEEFLLYLGFCDKKAPLSASLDFFRTFAGMFAHRLVQTPELESLRDKAIVAFIDEDKTEILEKIPYMTGAEHVNELLLDNLWVKLNNKFQKEIKAYNGSVEKFIKTYSPNVHLIGRIYFHLVESKKDEYPFAFLATYSTDISSEGKSKHVPLKHALSKYGLNSKKLLELLSTVQTASEKSSLIADILDTGEIFHPLAWSSADAFTFLKEIPIYENAGILCRIPNWWKNKSAGLSLNISVGNKQPSYLGMDSILDFRADLLLGDTQISEDEIRKLLKETDGLAFIKGKWIEVDHEKLKKTLEAFEKAKELMDNEALSLRDALRFQLDIKSHLNIEDEYISSGVTNGAWLKSIIEKLKDPELIKNAIPDKDFAAELRPYQQKGVNWLCYLDSLRLGACLADDMGLGKTIQLLALLSIIKNTKKNTNLLILPASLIDNWVREIDKFLPSLRYYIAHPSFQKKGFITIDGDSLDELKKYDLVITTYSLAGKYNWFQNYTWDYIILDEAQAIKNPGTKQTKQVKKLKSENRIIMTGTPIENKLSDLWSLFDFLNPGLLGTAKEFTAFTKTLKNNVKGYGKLRNVVSPYILRRLKTDKTVISDLPEKIEMKTYADLSKKQIVLYKKLVMELQSRLEQETEGIGRKGLILSSLMKFKQLCNHSDHYLGAGEYHENNSGKYLRLKEICQTILEKRERLLVFTQFKEITEPLKNYLTEIFQKKGLVLTGSTVVTKRRQIVEKFQGHEYVPFMVLSLKAGGVGLNLTAANHVIHFDRWWNPAVEDQATDRVFRIGQHKNVIVHKFITKGTIEEKIDTMLEEKKKLSSEIIKSKDESWITEMDNSQLLKMFTLKL